MESSWMLHPEDLERLGLMLAERCRDSGIAIDGDEAEDLARQMLQLFLSGVRDREALMGKSSAAA